MGEFVEFEVVDLGYYNPETGKDLPDITGRRNKPGIDPFTHKGNVYPSILKQRKKVLRLLQKGRQLLLELDITAEEADKITAFKAVKKTKEEVTADWGVNLNSGVTP